MPGQRSGFRAFSTNRLHFYVAQPGRDGAAQAWQCDSRAPACSSRLMRFIELFGEGHQRGRLYAESIGDLQQ